jgi:hypothetical protein
MPVSLSLERVAAGKTLPIQSLLALGYLYSNVKGIYYGTKAFRKVFGMKRFDLLKIISKWFDKKIANARGFHVQRRLHCIKILAFKAMNLTSEKPISQKNLGKKN